MKTLFTTLILLLAAVALALVARNEPGYVLIEYRGWTVEASLVLLLAAVAAGFFLLYYLIRLLSGTYRLPRRLGRWRQRRAEHKAWADFTRGAIELLAGRWDRAERQLIRSSRRDGPAVLNYLGAARAAQQLGARERRDRYLQLAYKSRPNAEVAIALTQAELQVAQGQYEEALATLTRLQRVAPRNTTVLERLMRLYSDLEDWERLLELLPALRKRHVVGREEAERLEAQAYTGMLRRAGDGRELHELWQRIPRDLRSSGPLLRDYILRLMDCGETAQAETAMSEALGRRWDEAVAYLYGRVEGADPSLQLKRAEQWLRGREDDPVLLLTLGRLCKRNGLWGKAREYLEASVAARPSAEGYNELAGMLERAGESDAAIQCYRKGMAAMENDIQGIVWGEESGSDMRRLLSVQRT